MKAVWETASLGDIFDIARGGSPHPIDDRITVQKLRTNIPLTKIDLKELERLLVERPKTGFLDRMTGFTGGGLNPNRDFRQNLQN